MLLAFNVINKWLKFLLEFVYKKLMCPHATHKQILVPTASSSRSTYLIFIEEVLFLLDVPKEKSWSVFLSDGYISNNQVTSGHCQNCKSTGDVLRVNFSNPNLLLYGCRDGKCKHRLLRLDLEQPIEFILQNRS